MAYSRTLVLLPRLVCAGGRKRERVRVRGTERKKRGEMGRDKPNEEERKTVDGGETVVNIRKVGKRARMRETGETRGRAAGITDKRGESQFDVNRV